MHLPRNDMTPAEKIAEEVRDLPDELACEILDFILFVEQRHAFGTQGAADAEPDWNQVRIDTRSWCFDREEANAR